MDSLTPLGEQIFLDRYAQKDPNVAQNLRVGDTVLVVEGAARLKGKTQSITDDRTWTTTLLDDGSLKTTSIDLIERPIETVRQMQTRVAQGIASVEKSPELRDLWSAKFFDVLADWEFVPGGRIWTSAGTNYKLTSYNCFVLPSPHDSRGGIMETLTRMIEIMSRGGGVGINFSSLRPKHAIVRGVNGRSSGPVSWMELFSVATGLIEQGGSRRGAEMAMLNDWHPDIFEFINAKRTPGKLTNCNISVCFSDAFMEALKNGGDWNLRFPDTTHPDYNALWTGDLAAWEAAGYPIINYQTIKAQELWDAVIESAHASAEPGIFFLDRANKMSNSHYYSPIVATNPCVTGDTRIYTDRGLIRAKDLFDSQQKFQVASDSRFGHTGHMLESSTVFKTGTKKVYRLTTKEGFSIRATADHRIMTPHGWQELQDLTPGDQIHILNRKGGFGTQGSLELGRTIGMVVGDGAITHGDKTVGIGFYDDKRELAPLFSGYIQDIVAGEQYKNRKYTTNVRHEHAHRDAVSSVRLYRIFERLGITEDKYVVPECVWQGTEDMQRGYLQGLFAADGHFAGNLEKGGAVRLTSVRKDLLESVQQLLLNFGIVATLYSDRRNGETTTTIHGIEYPCQILHELHMGGMNLAMFCHEIGFMNTTRQQKLEDYLQSKMRRPNRAKFYATVTAVEFDGIEDVYDLTVPVTHAFIGNGVVLHNCGEEPLPGWSVCNLAALNLSKFVKQNSPDQSVKPNEFVVDWMRLSEVIKIAVRFLDNVVDWTPYFYPENENQQRAERRLGLGVMGLADMMIRLGIRYGSDEGNTFIDDLGGFIARNAYSASVQLAQEKGSFPMFDADEFLASGFMQCMPEFIRNAVRQNGIRNVTILTIAPTGTTSTMLNTSGGVEPFFALEWDRKTRLGTHKETIAALQEWRAQHGEEDLPPYFVTSMDLTPEEHVKAMAAFQRWIDAAISKTVNFPKTATPQQVGELYQLMYDLGCKGGTVYVDQSRSEQVLNLTAPTESAVPQCDTCQIDMQPQEGCWVCTCGNTLCTV